MKYKLKTIWEVADDSQWDEAIDRLMESAFDDIKSDWEKMKQSAYEQLIRCYYDWYNPSMYGRIGGGYHLLSAYSVSAVSNIDSFDINEIFSTDGHWSITGSDNFTEEGIIEYIINGGRSVPPWVLKYPEGMTYNAEISIPEIGFSEFGNGGLVWRDADAAMDKYFTKKMSKLMAQKGKDIFFEIVKGRIV